MHFVLAVAKNAECFVTVPTESISQRERLTNEGDLEQSKQLICLISWSQTMSSGDLFLG